MKQLNIKIPSKIKLNLVEKDSALFFSNGESSIKLKISEKFKIIFTKNLLTIVSENNNNKNKQLLGAYKTLIQNDIKGLLQKFKITVNLKGVGFKTSLIKNQLQFKLGFSHEVFLEIPEGIIAQVFKPTQIILIASDLNGITQFANNIKRLKKPDSYKGKGILLSYDKSIPLKEGKRNKR